MIYALKKIPPPAAAEPGVDGHADATERWQVRNERKGVTMSWQMRTLGVLGLGLVLAQPSAAQERAVSVALRGGGFNGLSSLNEAGSADFGSVGTNAGLAVGVDVHRYVGLRGDLTFARNELSVDDEETGAELSRLFYDAAVQVQYPSASGLRPYAFVGAGGVTLHPVGSDDADATKFAGTGGIGVGYTIPGTGFGLLVEGKGWLYELSELGGDLSAYDRTQFDVTWSAGFTYRIPFGSSAARAN